MVLKEGDKGDFFYVVESGVYAVFKGNTQIHKYSVDEYAVNPSFGELAMMYAKPRQASVKCIERGTLWALDRVGFREAQKTSTGTDVIKILSKVELLKQLNFVRAARTPHHVADPARPTSHLHHRQTSQLRRAGRGRMEEAPLDYPRHPAPLP